MLRPISLSLLALCTLSASAVFAAEDLLPRNCVGYSESQDFDQHLLFQAPAEADDITMMEIFTVRDRRAQTPQMEPAMVFVPSSSLDLGDRSIQIKGFYIDQYEVSNAEYQRFITATGRQPPKSWEEGHYESGKGYEPVVGVTYDDAEAYAKWAGKRLPTEAEWELAATLAQNSKSLANFREDDEKIMNVGEWTSSCFGRNLGEDNGPPQFKTVRRGAVVKSEVNIPLIDRAPMHKCDCNEFTGFRCVKDIH